MLRHIVARASDKHLTDGRLSSKSRLAEAAAVDRNLPHVHQPQPLALHLVNHHGEYALLKRLVLGHEHQARAILALLGNGYALKQDELVGNLNHYSGTVAVLSHLGSAVAHILENPQRVVYQLVRLATMNIDYHAHSTGIVLVFGTIEPLLAAVRYVTFCHIILHFTNTLTEFWLQS